jgi:peptide/nickel transport system substrate-binding protein
VRDVRFRQALTFGMNRQEMIDGIYLGFAEPPTDIPSEYDPARANALLDEMGLDKRDADGFRLGPDGKVFELPIEHQGQMPEFAMTGELLVEHFQALGLKTTLQQIQGSLLGERTNANEVKVQLQWCSHPEMWCYTCGNWPYGYMNPAARLWVLWYQSGGEEGEDPETAGDVGKAYKLACDLMRDTVTVPAYERPSVVEEYTKVIYDAILRIPTVGGGSYAVLVSKDLGNIPTGGYGIAGNFCGEVFFRRQ